MVWGHVITHRWKEMSAETKKKYEDLAQKDKERFLEEKKNAPPSESESGSDSDSKGKGKGKGKGKKKKKGTWRADWCREGVPLA